MDLLNSLDKFGTKWAIVTSGTHVLASAWIEIMGLAKPDVLVTGDMVEKGKPAPEPYLSGAEKVGIKASKRVMVVEDAPAGIKAGKDAGCFVIGLLTSHSEESVRAAEPDIVIRDLSELRIIGGDGEGIEVEYEQ